MEIAATFGGTCTKGEMIFHCLRLHRGDDLMVSIKELCRQREIDAGVVLSAFGYFFYDLVYLGIAAFSLSLVVQLVTLPVEFDASRRAINAISQSDILSGEEMVGARRTLRAAAMTYVAATAVSIAEILRLILIFGGRRRRD